MHTQPPAPRTDMPDTRNTTNTMTASSATRRTTDLMVTVLKERVDVRARAAASTSRANGVRRNGV